MFNLKISKQWKKLLAVSFCTIMLVVFISCFFTTNTAYADENKSIIVFNDSADMAALTFKGYNNGTIEVPTTVIGCIKYTQQVFFMGDDYNGPIGICKAILFDGKHYKSVYLVAMSGTELIYSNETGLQSTGVITDLLAAFDKENPYKKAVRNAILSYIPKNSDILLYGHSLGGMVAQEIAADYKIKSKYNILNVITFGSPLCAYTSGREGIVKRLCDKSDIVPYCSKYTLSKFIFEQLHGSEKCVEDGGYNLFKCLCAHNESYMRKDLWNKYDVLGKLGGNSKIVLDYSKMKYFDAQISI